MFRRANCGCAGRDKRAIAWQQLAWLPARPRLDMFRNERFWVQVRLFR